MRIRVEYRRGIKTVQPALDPPREMSFTIIQSKECQPMPAHSHSPAVPVDESSRQSLASRYLRLRDVTRRLNDQLIRQLSKDVLHEGASRLGLLHGDVLTFDDEGQMPVLMDYCIYEVRRRGRNALEQFLSEFPPRPGSDDAAMLEAMSQSIYSLFAIESVEPGLGVVVCDQFSDERYLVADMGLSQTGEPGVAMLSRLVVLEEFAITSGSAVLLGQTTPESLARLRMKWKQISPQGRSPELDPADLIRTVWERGGGGRVRFADPRSNRPRDPAARVARSKQAADLKARQASRNVTRRCPCGSGKMFKNCCLKKPR